MSEAEAATHKQPNYAAVFWSLFILTILEIFTAQLPVAKIIIVLSLIFLALVKAALVALYYMHLKFEKLIIYFIVVFPLFLAAILTILVLLDKPQILK